MGAGAPSGPAPHPVRPPGCRGLLHAGCGRIVAGRAVPRARRREKHPRGHGRAGNGRPRPDNRARSLPALTPTQVRAGHPPAHPGTTGQQRTRNKPGQHPAAAVELLGNSPNGQPSNTTHHQAPQRQRRKQGSGHGQQNGRGAPTRDRAGGPRHRLGRRVRARRRAGRGQGDRPPRPARPRGPRAGPPYPRRRLPRGESAASRRRSPSAPPVTSPRSAGSRPPRPSWSGTPRRSSSTRASPRSSSPRPCPPTGRSPWSPPPCR